MTNLPRLHSPAIGHFGPNSAANKKASRLHSRRFREGIAGHAIHLEPGSI